MLLQAHESIDFAQQVVVLVHFHPEFPSASIFPSFSHSGRVSPGFQIQRPSGRFLGVLNVAAAVINPLDWNYGDRPPRSNRQRTAKGEKLSGGESCAHSCAESADYSDGADSTTSSSSRASTVLKDCNILKEVAGTTHSNRTVEE